MTSPCFSVVIPVYNRSKEIAPALESLLAQTDADFECIVVDDGSKDGQALREVVDALGDDRFRYLRRENGGGGAARNSGIEAARGRYVAFLDSDDRFLPEKLAVVREHFANTACEALYSRAFVDRGGPDCVWVRPDRAIAPGEDMGEYLFVANQFVQTSTIVMSADAARRVMFDPSLRKGQDLDFCVRAHAEGIRFSMLDRPLIVWLDASEVGRTSRHAGTRAPVEWIERNAHLLTQRAQAGYRATVLAYYQPKSRALRVASDFVAGLRAGVPPKVIARQALRFVLPRSWYRTLVDTFVRARTKSKRQ
ncbi:glycosyltransferase family 2 protein [Lysobacter sp. KIS68-7]|uniref:glycosyltransferase family 2 protein n=1 Tax=Lysobacter sp. KIS68-7 TaxID=2904252 RepID=UPI001E5DAC85|nr:glycosyltransferase family A protein [Lysobacter sp. KIS68-7]UHQ18466.1 glycosyltransferase family 2 protein [Lysobacter sp. KIS68-7]